MDRTKIIEFVDKHLESIKQSDTAQAIQHCKVITWLNEAGKKTYEQYEDMCFHLGIAAIITNNFVEA